jgi:hypothetical protein
VALPYQKCASPHPEKHHRAGDDGGCPIATHAAKHSEEDPVEAGDREPHTGDGQDGGDTGGVGAGARHQPVAEPVSGDDEQHQHGAANRRLIEHEGPEDTHDRLTVLPSVSLGYEPHPRPAKAEVEEGAVPGDGEGDAVRAVVGVAEAREHHGNGDESEGDAEDGHSNGRQGRT